MIPIYLLRRKIIDMLDEINNVIDIEPMKEDDTVQIGDIPVDRVGLKNVENALVTLKWFWEQKPIDVTPLIQSNQTLQEEIRPWHAQESHQSTLDLFFHYA